MKKKLFVALLSAAMVMSAGFAVAGCKNDTPDDPEPPIVEPQHTAPVITVLSGTEVMEIYAGDDFDPLFGITAKDEDGKDVDVMVSDDGGFDKDTVGEYTLTYSATAYGLTSNATRTVRVLEELAPVTLEVRQDKFNKPVWESKEKINFKHREYYELSESCDYTDPLSGVFHNASSQEITVNIEGGYGVSAVIDANGVVIEGRDGANGKLVNAENPTRATSSATTITVGGESAEVLSNFAKELKIPAGGFAVVVQNGYAGTTADTDGRGYMNYNVICEYGNVVRLYWADSEGTYLTEYVNQKPVVSGNSDVVASQHDAEFDLETAVKAGLTVKDDNGTFEVSDDTVITEINVVDDGGFDITLAGDYTVTLSVTDGALTTTFTRNVKVVANEEAVEVSFNGNTIRLLKSGIAIDTELTAVGNYNLIIYTYAYKAEHAELGFATGYGSAYVVDRYGKIVRTYDGANGRYNDATHDDVSDAELCAAATYASQAYASLAEGETVFIAPHNTANGNSSAGGTRNTFMQKANRTAIGKAFSCTGFVFEEKPYVITVGEKSYTAMESKYAYNTAVDTPANYSMIVFTKAYTETPDLTGYKYGAAVVLDKYGKLIKVYDGANVGVYDETGKLETPEGFGAATYATYAWENLAEGETLIIFPNDGGSNEARAFCLGLRTDGSIGKTVSLTDIIFADPDATDEPDLPVENSIEFTVGEKKFAAVESKYAYNTAVETPANYGMIVFTKAYTETLDLTGYKYGAAAVLDKYGKLIKVYDGANVGVYDETGKLETPEGFGAATYATYAWENLAEGETLIIFPNDGGSNEARAFCLGLRTDGSIGKTVSLTGVEFEKAEA